MLDVLESRRVSSNDLQASILCHEDLNPNNLLFAMCDGQPVLSGILDFESAWAEHWAVTDEVCAELGITPIRFF